MPVTPTANGAPASSERVLLFEDGDVIGFPQREQSTEPEPLWREAVGRELRTERTHQERTLADVAEEAGVSTQYLSEIERGRKEPARRSWVPSPARWVCGWSTSRRG